MGTAAVILDWMREQSDAFAPPGPASAEELAALADAGAPAELIALYRLVSDDVPGLLRWPVTGELCRLLSPREVCNNGGTWAFAQGDDGDLVLIGGGRVVHRNGRETAVADGLEALLREHLAWILAGGLAWHPDREQFALSSEVARAGLLARTVAQGTGRMDALSLWTDEIIDALRAGSKAKIHGVGEMTVSVRRAFTGHNPRTGEQMHVPAVSVPVLRASARLKWLLNQAGPDPGAPAVAIRGIALGRTAGKALALSLGDMLAAELLAGHRVCWPRLGELSASQRRGFDGHNPRTGEAMHVPAVTIPVFRAGDSLKRLLNPR